MASGAVVAKYAPMEFIHRVGSSLLMQPVNVLGHNGIQLSLLLPLRKLFVGDIGFKTKRKHLFPVKPEEIRRIAHIKTVADDGLRRVLKMLVI